MTASSVCGSAVLFKMVTVDRDKIFKCLISQSRQPDSGLSW